MLGAPFGQTAPTDHKYFAIEIDIGDDHVGPKVAGNPSGGFLLFIVPPSPRHRMDDRKPCTAIISNYSELDRQTCCVDAYVKRHVAIHLDEYGSREGLADPAARQLVLSSRTRDPDSFSFHNCVIHNRAIPGHCMPDR